MPAIIISEDVALKRRRTHTSRQTGTTCFLWATSSFFKSKLAEVLIAQGLLKEAADIVSILRDEDPNDPEITALYAKLLLADDGVTPQQLDSLITNLTAASKRAREKYEVELELGRVYARKSDRASIELARKYLERSLTVRPDSISARSALSQLLLSTKDYGRALTLSEEVLKIDPENSEVKAVQSEILKRLAPTGQTRKPARKR